MRHYAQIAASLVALAVLGTAAPYMPAHTYGKPRYQPHEVEAAKESIALSLLGQLQMSVGDLMWLKSMEYLHIGVMQRMPTRAEEEHGYRKHDSLNTAAGLGHTEGVSMVLDRERDWRGIFGEIERNVVPYIGEHRHDDPVELIPWYRLAVRMNPSLERLYTLGAFYLADFAHEPGEARQLLEAGLDANPFSFEIHGALGRLYVDFADKLQDLKINADEHLKTAEKVASEIDALTREGAYTKGAELLKSAVELANEQRRQMAANRQLFDDFQNQVFGESYLYLSKARLALGDYEGAIAAADEGYSTVSQYSQRNLLRVQARVARKALGGEAAADDELAQLTKVRTYAEANNGLPEPTGTSNSDWVESPLSPVSVLAGIEPPTDFPRDIDADILRPVLNDLHAYPYETPAARSARLGMPEADMKHRLDALTALRFAEPVAVDGVITHALTPPGLYVARGDYGFDFWDQMQREAQELKAKSGDHVPLDAGESGTQQEKAFE